MRIICLAFFFFCPLMLTLFGSGSVRVCLFGCLLCLKTYLIERWNFTEQGLIYLEMAYSTQVQLFRSCGRLLLFFCFPSLKLYISAIISRETEMNFSLPIWASTDPFCQKRIIIHAHLWHKVGKNSKQ